MTGSAVPVAVHGFTWTAALVLVLNLLCGGALVALIRNMPKLRELALTARRGDLDDMRERISELEAKVEAASAAAHMAELKLVYAVNAVQLLTASLRALDPADPTIAQAMEMLKAATHGGLAEWGTKLAQGLHTVKGTGE